MNQTEKNDFRTKIRKMDYFISLNVYTCNGNWNCNTRLLPFNRLIAHVNVIHKDK